MKLSNKLLFAGFLMPIFCTVILVFALSGKNTTDEVYQLKNAPEFIFSQIGEFLKGPTAEYSLENQRSKRFNFSNYNILVFEGAWEISIEKSKDELYVTGTHELMDKVRIEQNGKILSFTVENIKQYEMMKANISLPDFKGVICKGAANITLTDITNTDDVFIKCEGVSNIDTDNISIKKLTLKADGAINADFTKGFVNRLKLDYQAVGNIDIYLNEGIITGNMGGSGSLNVYGNVLNNQLDLKSDSVKVNIK